MENKDKIETATLKITLKSKYGKEVKHECKVNQWQAEIIGVILEKENMTEQDLVKIKNELE